MSEYVRVRGTRGDVSTASLWPIPRPASSRLEHTFSITEADSAAGQWMSRDGIDEDVEREGFFPAVRAEIGDPGFGKDVDVDQCSSVDLDSEEIFTPP